MNGNESLLASGEKRWRLGVQLKSPSIWYTGSPWNSPYMWQPEHWGCSTPNGSGIGFPGTTISAWITNEKIRCFVLHEATRRFIMMRIYKRLVDFVQLVRERLPIPLPAGSLRSRSIVWEEMMASGEPSVVPLGTPAPASVFSGGNWRDSLRCGVNKALTRYKSARYLRISHHLDLQMCRRIHLSPRVFLTFRDGGVVTVVRRMEIINVTYSVNRILICQKPSSHFRSGTQHGTAF